MAPSAEVLLSFLFILVLFSSPQIQARESQFFSKVTRYRSPTETAKEPSTEYPEAPVYSPTSAPAPAPASELFQFQRDTQDGHGLYGRGSNKFSPTTTTTTTVGENEVVPEELSNESYKELAENSYSNNKNGYSTEYYNNNGHTTEKQGMSDTRYLENGRYYYNANGYSTNSNNNGYSTTYNNNGYSTTSNNNGYSTNSNNNGYSTNSNNNGYSTTYNNNGYSTTSNNNGYSTNSNNNGYSTTYNNNGYSTTSNNNGYSTTSNNNAYSAEKQGMSDTRFLENGKFFYNLKNENHQLDGYNTEKGSTSNEGYYGNTENSNEFNSKEEYLGQQEYQEGEEEYIP